MATKIAAIGERYAQVVVYSAKGVEQHKCKALMFWCLLIPKQTSNEQINIFADALFRAGEDTLEYFGICYLNARAQDAGQALLSHGSASNSHTSLPDTAPFRQHWP